jgi:hypothetical protein
MVRYGTKQCCWSLLLIISLEHFLFWSVTFYVTNYSVLGLHLWSGKIFRYLKADLRSWLFHMHWLETFRWKHVACCGINILFSCSFLLCKVRCSQSSDKCIKCVCNSDVSSISSPSFIKEVANAVTITWCTDRRFGILFALPLKHRGIRDVCLMSPLHCR